MRPCLFQLISLTKNDAFRIEGWAAQAELLRVRDIIGDDAYLLIVAGVRDCADLARQTGTALHSRVTDLAAKLRLANSKLDPEVTKRWGCSRIRLTAKRWRQLVQVRSMEGELGGVADAQRAEAPSPGRGSASTSADCWPPRRPLVVQSRIVAILIAFPIDLAMSVGRAATIDDVGPQDWQEFAKSCGLAPRYVEQRVTSVVTRAYHALQVTADELLAEGRRPDCDGNRQENDRVALRCDAIRYTAAEAGNHGDA